LTTDPRLTAEWKGSELVARVANQMSPPWLPGRSEMKKSESPSSETLGPPSNPGLLSGRSVGAAKSNGGGGGFGFGNRINLPE